MFTDSLNSGSAFYGFCVLPGDHTDPSSLPWDCLTLLGTLPRSLMEHKPPSFAYPCLQVMAVLQKGTICSGLLGQGITRDAE